MRFHVILWLACCSGAVVASLNHFMDASFPRNPLNQLDRDELDITPIPTSPIEDHVLGVHEDAEAKLDTAFYSRQLYVYGKSAQVKLTNAHIAIIGDGALAQEIVKNLALGGVGYITIVTDAGVAGMDTDRSKQASILGEDSDLLHYAKALNPHVHVDQLEYHNHTLPTEDVLGRNISHVIVCGEDLHRLLEINRWTRQHFLRLTAGQVQGVSGYIFNDFHFAFDIEDIEGESYKDIPLKFQCQLLEEERIEVSSIDEERLNYGLEDVVEIRSAKNIDHVYHGIVKRIISPTTCVVHIVDERFDMRGFLQGMKELIEAGDAVIQKMKSQLTIAHQPLLHQLLKPKFIPINGCLSKKQDQALNLALFAAIKTQDMLSRRNKASKKISDRVFFELMLQELQLLGVEDPLLPLKQGGKVGKEWIDYVFSRFYHSAAGGQCPATISVLGSLMAQEVMKGITQMYTPISQWYLFESLDALHDNQSKSRSVEDMKRSVEYHVQAASLDHKTSRAGSAVDMYDFEVLEEIRKMKIFIVGSGAIGCELLKTFALLGIGANEASTQSQDMENVGEDEELPSYDSLNLWQEHGLSDGGILITDMDMIERSNLNRQLLFRERHIGQAKSQVAATQILHINPKLKVKGLQLKMSTDTENIFSEQFWKSCDMVVTALDNVDARKYIDGKCVEHKVFMVDSGTLGTKANVQVVLPYLTESYGSSNDPPDESIPLCTLKSFPYQPEHCVAWAKNVFEQSFSDGILRLKDYLTLITSSTVSEGKGKVLDDYLENLSNDDVVRLHQQMQYLQQLSASNHAEHPEMFLQVLLDWSWDALSRYFNRDIVQLLQEHPADEVDEEQLPFWGGSRRMPTALQVQDVKQSETALGFLKYHMFLISRTLFASQNCLGMQRIEQTVESFISTSPTFSNQPTVSLDEAKHSLKQFVQQHQVHEAIHHFMKKVLQFEPASFEKDDLSLGHVQFVMFASNLRSQNYALQALDQLQVQKIAGNIVPALATTTSLVAGMVSLEVMKIASERVLERRKRILLEHGVHSDAEANALVDDQFLDSVLNKRKEQAKEYVRGLLRKIKSFRPLGKSTENEAAGIDITKELVAESNSQRFDFKLWKEDKDRILKRFRNSFINIASPLLAFTQPVESESYSVGNMHFNQWDDIELEGDITSITMQDLLVNLQEKYGVVPSSVSFDDIMLYANYLPPTEELLQSSLFVLLQTQLEDANLYEDGPVKTLLQGKKSISLLVTGDLIQVEGQDDAEEQDVTLPPLKIRIPDTLFSTTTPSTELPPLPFETELTSEEKEKEVEMEKDVEKLLQGLAQDVDSGMLSAKVMKYLADQVTSTLPSEEEYPGFEDDELQGESEEESLPTSDGDEEVVATEDDSSTQHTTEKNLSGNSITVPITKKAKRTIFTSFRRILSKSSTKRKKNVHKKKGKGKLKKIDKSLKEEKKDDDLSDLSDLSDLYASEEPSDQEEQQPQQ